MVLSSYCLLHKNTEGGGAGPGVHPSDSNDGEHEGDANSLHIVSCILNGDDTITVVVIGSESGTFGT